MTRSATRTFGHVVFATIAAGVGAVTAQPQSTATSASRPEPSAEDAAYIRMATVAASQISEIANGRTVALYRTNSQSPVISGMESSVLETYDFREIRPGDEAYKCTPQQRRARSMMDALPNCTINVAELLVQLNSVQLMGDSGYVGGLITQAVRGETRPRTTAICLTAVRRGAAWLAATHSEVPTPRDCAQDRKH
jgi:hypothetical protein